MFDRVPSFFTFVVRLWKSDDKGIKWGGSLTNIKSGKKVFFHDWEVLIKGIVKDFFAD